MCPLPATVSRLCGGHQKVGPVLVLRRGIGGLYGDDLTDPEDSGLFPSAPGKQVFDVFRNGVGVKPGVARHLIDTTGARAAKPKESVRVGAPVAVIP